MTSSLTNNIQFHCRTRDFFVCVRKTTCLVHKKKSDTYTTGRIPGPGGLCETNQHTPAGSAATEGAHRAKEKHLAAYCFVVIWSGPLRTATPFSSWTVGRSNTPDFSGPRSYSTSSTRREATRICSQSSAPPTPAQPAPGSRPASPSAPERKGDTQ